MNIKGVTQLVYDATIPERDGKIPFEELSDFDRLIYVPGVSGFRLRNHYLHCRGTYRNRYTGQQSHTARPVGNAEAQEVYQELLDSVSFIATDPTWSNIMNIKGMQREI